LGGNDTIYAASLKLDVYDTWGHLYIYGAAGFMTVDKSGWGNMSVLTIFCTNNNILIT
jgi:hypothetical protein